MPITVCISSFNHRQYVGNAIESVLRQTLRPTQIIVVDDCSTDGSAEIIAGYAAKYPELILPIYHEKNRGVASARVSALQKVRTQYVTYLDSDDEYLPEKLEQEIKLLQQEEGVQFAFSNYYLIDESGQRQETWLSSEDLLNNLFERILACDFPYKSPFRYELVDFKFLQMVGFHNLDLKTHSDWELKVRLVRQGSAAFTLQPLSVYRRHANTVSSSAAINRYRSVRQIYSIYRRELHHCSKVGSPVQLNKYETLMNLAWQVWNECEKKDPRKIYFWAVYKYYNSRYKLEKRMGARHFGDGRQRASRLPLR
ncbi:MAG: glycosyltransferase family 2 protein [Cyanobacteria bacterium P01_H01_bin.15]